MISLDHAARQQVYFVEELVENPTVKIGPLAIKPYIKMDTIYWQTTSPSLPGVSLKIDKISLSKIQGDKEREIDLLTKSGDHFKLIPLTREIYIQKVKSRLIDAPEFQNDKELKHYFLETDFKAY